MGAQCGPSLGWGLGVGGDTCSFEWSWLLGVCPRGAGVSPIPVFSIDRYIFLERETRRKARAVEIISLRSSAAFLCSTTPSCVQIRRYGPLHGSAAYRSLTNAENTSACVCNSVTARYRMLLLESYVDDASSRFQTSASVDDNSGPIDASSRIS